MSVKIGDFKGNPTIGIPCGTKKDGETYYFNFGLRKAKAILDHLDDIKKFISDHEKPQANSDDVPF